MPLRLQRRTRPALSHFQGDNSVLRVIRHGDAKMLVEGRIVENAFSEEIKDIIV